MILVSVSDCKTYWEQRGLLYAYMRIGMITKAEADSFAANDCPDLETREYLQAANKRKREEACAKGDHVRQYAVSEDEIPRCLFCGVPMPYTDEEKAQFKR